MGSVILECSICRLSYIEGVDNRQHLVYHQQFLADYEQTIAGDYAQWCGRPEIERGGVYQALHELNPRLLGLDISGLSKNDIEKFQDGAGTIIEQGGSGHDRTGEWYTPDGKTYKYHANWNCGHAHFRSPQ